MKPPHQLYQELVRLRDEIEIKTVHWALSRKADIESGKPDSDITQKLEREVFREASAWPNGTPFSAPCTKPIHNKAIAWARTKDEHMRTILRNDLYHIALIYREI